jgi:Leucine-rich repeat (LRR) protein
LEINDWGNEPLNEIVDFISKNMAKLENLSITEISSNTKFPTLKKLKVNYIRNSRKLINFIVGNNGIEVLKVGLVYISQIQNFIEDLKSLNNVKHLSIGGNKTALRAMLNNLMLTKDLPEELKTLELSIIADAGKQEDKKQMKLAIPFDPIDLKLKYSILA